MGTGERSWELDPHQKVCCLVCTHISRPQDGQSREPGSLGACLLPSSLVPYSLPAWLLMPLHLQGVSTSPRRCCLMRDQKSHSLHLQPQASCPTSTDCPLSNFALPRAAHKVSPGPENNSSPAWSPRRPRSLPRIPHLPTYASSHLPQACLHMPGPSTCMLFYTCPGSSPSPTQPALSDKTVFASLR